LKKGIYIVTSPELMTALLVEQRVFQHQLLYTLVEVGALTNEQASAFCVDMAERLPEATTGISAAPVMTPLLVQKVEGIASAMIGMNKLPRGE
jgi:polyhydroxyalkanoate synthesis regulator phasin